MPALGFSKEVTDWFKSYPSSRKFQVDVHNKFYSSADMELQKDPFPGVYCFYYMSTTCHKP